MSWLKTGWLISTNEPGGKHWRKICDIRRTSQFLPNLKCRTEHKRPTAILSPYPPSPQQSLPTQWGEGGASGVGWFPLPGLSILRPEHFLLLQIWSFWPPWLCHFGKECETESECRFSFLGGRGGIELMIWLGQWITYATVLTPQSEIWTPEERTYQRVGGLAWHKLSLVTEFNVLPPPSVGKCFTMSLASHRIILSYTVDGTLYFQYFYFFLVMKVLYTHCRKLETTNHYKQAKQKQLIIPQSKVNHH